MRTTVTLWVVATLLTLVLGAWQRVSGPTYPVYGKADLGASAFAYTLERTHAGAGDHVVRIPAAAGRVATVDWREHAAGAAQAPAPWRPVEMTASPDGRSLEGALPHHGPGGKVDYRVVVSEGGASQTLPPAGLATLRFRSDVPAWVLIPHIIAMMGALLLAVRVALECFRRRPNLRFLTLRTLSALFVGGFPLGCAVSGYAFGQPWGGFPFGNDATDNKTLIAFAGWIVATVAVMRLRNPRPFVLGAAVLMLLVYMVPHSLSLPPR
jgi:hypothetical protein